MSPWPNPFETSLKKARMRFYGRVVLVEGVSHQAFVSFVAKKILPAGACWNVYVGVIAPEGWTEGQADQWRSQIRIKKSLAERQFVSQKSSAGVTQ